MMNDPAISLAEQNLNLVGESDYDTMCRMSQDK